jgi:hypothetical protein
MNLRHVEIIPKSLPLMSVVVLSDTEPELYSPREKMILEPQVVVKKRPSDPK